MLHFEIDIDAPREEVWRALLDRRAGWGEARGRELRVVSMEAPAVLRLADGASEVTVSLSTWRGGLTNVSLVERGLGGQDPEPGAEWTLRLRALRSALETRRTL